MALETYICPGRAPCPIGEPAQLRQVRTTVIEPGGTWFCVYPQRWSDELFNTAGTGDARFSPLQNGMIAVPHLYLARNPVGALLETVFHEFTTANRHVSVAADLVGRGLRQVTIPDRLLLADMRDSELGRHGLGRSQLVSSTGDHYPCTRRWAHRLRSLKPGGHQLSGIMWNSRVAEIAGSVARPTTHALLQGPSTEVCVIYGDRVRTLSLNEWNPTVSHGDLSTGSGLEFVIDLAVQLDGFVS